MYLPQKERREEKTVVSVEGLSEQIDTEISVGWILKYWVRALISNSGTLFEVR